MRLDWIIFSNKQRKVVEIEVVKQRGQIGRESKKGYLCIPHSLSPLDTPRK